MWAYDRGELGDNVEVSRTDDALIVGRRLSNEGASSKETGATGARGLQVRVLYRFTSERKPTSQAAVTGSTIWIPTGTIERGGAGPVGH